MLGLIGRVRPPDRLENGAMRQHASWMLRQIREQLKLFRREAYLLAISDDAEALAIDDQPATCDRTASAERAVGASQRSADARKQFIGAKRLRHVVISAGVERRHLVTLSATRGEDDDRRARYMAHLTAYLDAVEVGQ